jgi:hypothetical protein
MRLETIQLVTLPGSPTDAFIAHVLHYDCQIASMAVESVTQQRIPRLNGCV